MDKLIIKYYSYYIANSLRSEYMKEQIIRKIFKWYNIDSVYCIKGEDIDGVSNTYCSSRSFSYQ